MTKYTNLCHDMRRKRRKQSITANRRKWCKIKENQCFQGAKALAFLNSAVDKTTILGKLHFFFRYDNFFSNLLYKLFFIWRKIILFILGKNSKI